MKCFGNLNHSLAELCVHNTKSFLALNIFFIFCILKTFLCFFTEYKRSNIVVIRIPNSGKFTLGHSVLSIYT